MAADKKLEAAWRSDLDMLTDEVRHLHGNLQSGTEAPGSSSTSEEDKYKALFRQLHALNTSHDRAALCLSGGGIRSATFGLGVLQGLASRGQLRRFHYLSTVSGGGYIGSWLSSWIQRESLRPPPDTTVAGETQDEVTLADQARDRVINRLAAVQSGQTVEPEPVRGLRAYSNYLSPVRGLSGDVLALIATYLRNLFLNWLVLVPLLLAVLMLPRLLVSLLLLDKVPAWCWYTALAVVVLGTACCIAYIASDLPPTPEAGGSAGRRPGWDKAFPLCILPLVLAALSLSLLATWLARDPGSMPEWWRSLAKWLAAGGRLYYFLGFGAAGALLHIVAGAFGHLVLRSWRDAVPAPRPPGWRTWLGVLLSGLIGGIIVGLFFLWLESKWQTIKADERDQFVGWYTTLAVPMLMAVFWVGATVFVGWGRKRGSVDDREWWARATGGWLYAAGAWLLLSLLVVQLPPWILSMRWLDTSASPGAIGVGTTLLGLITGAAGYWSRHGPALQKRADTIAAALGLRLLEVAAAAFLLLLMLGLTLGISQAQLAWLPDVELRAKAAEQRVEEDALQADKQAYARANPTREPPKYWACAPKDKNDDADKRSADGECAGWAERLAARYSASVFGLKAIEWPADAGHRGYSFAPPVYLLLATAVLLLLSVIVSWRIGTNAFSLHDMYGIRLVRAYLGTTRDSQARHPHWYTGFDHRDNLAMDELPGAERATPAASRPRLFHVVNIALNLVAPSDKRSEWQERKAASFTITPRYAGSVPTGYVPSWLYANTSDGPFDPAHPPARVCDGISLGRALTISGAAAAPNMGYHSSMAVAMVMGFFNIRLGAWMPNPKREFASTWTRSEPRFSLDNSVAELLTKTSDDTHFVSLSDGGHFENLGLYEMVRRRVKHIVVIDATCDPKYEFADLEGAIRKIRVDLGIEVRFPDGLPGPVELGRNGHALAVGEIRYRTADEDAPDGRLYYLKPMLFDDLPLDVERYAASTRQQNSKGGPFPQQSTSDQFFEETQFESYRRLGLHCALRSFPTEGHWPEALRKGSPTGTAASAVADDDGPVAAAPAGASGWLERASQVAQSVRPDALLASLAAVGVIGVTVTATLSNPTVMLAPGATVGIDTSALQKLPVVISDPEVGKATAALKALKEQVDATADSLRGSGDRRGLVTLLDSMSGQLETIATQGLPTQVEAAASQASQAAAALRAFRDALPTNTNMKDLEGAARKVANAASALETAAGKLGSAADKTVTLDEKQIKAIERAASDIADIRDRVNELPPRRNLRGTAEGSKP